MIEFEMPIELYANTRYNIEIKEPAILISVGRYDGIGLYFDAPNVVITPNHRHFSWLHQYQERFYTVDTLGM